MTIKTKLLLQFQYLDMSQCALKSKSQEISPRGTSKAFPQPFLCFTAGTNTISCWPLRGSCPPPHQKKPLDLGWEKGNEKGARQEHHCRHRGGLQRMGHWIFQAPTTSQGGPAATPRPASKLTLVASSYKWHLGWEEGCRGPKFQSLLQYISWPKPLQVPGPGSQDGRDPTESQASTQEHPGTKGGQGKQEGSSHPRAKAIKILLGPCPLAGRASAAGKHGSAWRHTSIGARGSRAWQELHEQQPVPN